MTPSDRPSAVIFGLAGLSLTEAERELFRRVRPVGYILFARNVDTPDQVRALTAELAALCPTDPPMILIDQEGGRVQRLRPPHWREYPPMRPFGELYGADPDKAEAALRANNHLIASDLRDIGVTVSCAPVMDVPVPGAHDIIGDRAFSEDPHVVRALAGPACEGLLRGGVAPVIKHLPGHGRAMSDSHKDLPRISTDLETLKTTDFVPFRGFDTTPCYAMTAHVVLEAVDPDTPVTTSAKAISEIIRGELQFDGLLMTDDLGMHALTGPFDERAAACLEAGCDVVLHCSGDFDEMEAVARAVTPLSDAAFAAAQGVLNAADASKTPINRASACAEVENILSA